MDRSQAAGLYGHVTVPALNFAPGNREGGVSEQSRCWHYGLCVCPVGPRLRRKGLRPKRTHRSSETLVSAARGGPDALCAPHGAAAQERGRSLCISDPPLGHLRQQPLCCTQRPGQAEIWVLT